MFTLTQIQTFTLPLRHYLSRKIHNLIAFLKEKGDPSVY